MLIVSLNVDVVDRGPYRSKTTRSSQILELKFLFIMCTCVGTCLELQGVCVMCAHIKGIPSRNRAESSANGISPLMVFGDLWYVKVEKEVKRVQKVLFS
jgi:hypothetical protein